MSESPPTERQVLYALVALGFHVITGVLAVGAAVVGLSPRWWTIGFGVVWSVVAVWGAVRWRRTGPILMGSLAVLVSWVVGALVTR